MKIKYKYRLITYFFLLFLLFGGSVIIIQQKTEERQRILALESQLDGYVYILNNYIKLENIQKERDLNKIQEISNMFPDSLRITILDQKGKVLFDNRVGDFYNLPNHLNRPEMRQAIYQNIGWNIRKSQTTLQPYLYFARYDKPYYIRVALPYNKDLRNLLAPDYSFTYAVFFLLIAMLITLYFISNRLSRTIKKLRKLTNDIKQGLPIPTSYSFPNDELGDIAKDLFNVVEQMNKANEKITTEREKLIHHFRYSKNGLAIFNEHKELIYANTHFYRLANIITKNTTFEVNEFLKEDIIQPISDFIQEKDRTEKYKSLHIERNGKYLHIKVSIFDDNSFEIIISDNTKVEKTKLIKKEITSNVAHELRTPITAIRGYLEILNEKSDKLTIEQREVFEKKAYLQSVRLSHLIEDISLLSKIEGAPNNFLFKQVDLTMIINSCRIELLDRLTENHISLFYEKDQPIYIRGNEALLYSIFFNLIENSVKYAGKNAEIHIFKSNEDKENLYITLYDTGKGVDDIHLPRLFERFYRVHEGRTREDGGSGLGLSIVINSVRVHNGDISVKRHPSGGLEFLIRLPK